MDYIKRDLEAELEKYMSFKEIIAVIGPRQAGKTTIINNILDKIKNKKINKISFENFKSLNLFEEDIDNFIKKEIDGYDIVFIDEVQYSKNSGQKLKYIYDTKNVKLIISGSSATELSIHSIKYLVGRIFIFELQTLSFGEFLRFKNERLYNIYLKNDYKKVILDEINSLILEYIKYGGYPRVVLMKEEKDKILVLENIFNTYMLKEISEILQFKENHLIEKLLKFLASQIGGVINYTDLSVKTGIEYRELKNNLNILEKTFITYYLLNFHTNKQTEIVKSPKIYFYDFGMRNIILNNFNIENSLGDVGKLYENFIVLELLKNKQKIKFWRTKTKAEVDLIVEKDGKLIPIEVKSKINSNIVEKSFRSFIEKYSPERGYILSLDYNDKRVVDLCEINFLSFASFLSDQYK